MMRKVALLIAIMVLGCTPLWAPPITTPTVEVISNPPSTTATCTSNAIKKVKSTGNEYACLGGHWTLLPISPQELDATNTASAGLFVQVDPFDATKFQFVAGTAGGGGGGTSSISENTGTIPTATAGNSTSAATILKFWKGLDVNITQTTSAGDTANIGLDYTEYPIDLTTGSGMFTGTLPVTAGGTGATTAAGARANISAAASGANTDIASLDLTTPLSVSDGGTGLSTIAVNQAFVGSSTNNVVVRTIPSCGAGNQLQFKQSGGGTCAATSEAGPCFDCAADGSAGTGTIKDIQEEGALVGASGSGTALNFVGAALTAAGAGATKTITLAQTGVGTSVVDNAYTLTGGAGLNISNVDTAQPLTGSNLTFTTDSTETAFLAAAASTCNGSDDGKLTYTTSTPIQWCSTGTLGGLYSGANDTKYAALGNSAGSALRGADASNFFVANQPLPVTKGGTNATSVGTAAGQVVIANGTSAMTAYPGLAFDSITSTLTVGGPVVSSGAPDGSRYAEIQRNSFTSDPTATSDYIRLYAKATNNVAGNEKLYTRSVTGGIKEVLAAPVTEDAILVGNNAAASATTPGYQAVVLPNCNSVTEKLYYSVGSNAFSCATDVSGGSVSGSHVNGLVYDSAGSAVEIPNLIWTNASTKLAATDSVLIDLSAVNNSSTTEGLVLPQANDVTAGTANGQIAWDSDDDLLRVGTGAAQKTMADLSSTQTITGVKTFTANPVITAITSPGAFTYTMPNEENDTLVGRTSADTLTTKTIATTTASGNVITIKDVDFIPIGWCTDGSVAPAAIATLTSTNSVQVRDFSGAADNDVQCPWQVPFDFSGGTITFRVISFVDNATAIANGEIAAFSLAGNSLANSEILSGALGTAQTSQLTADATYVRYDRLATAFSPAITVTGIAAGETAILKLIRLAASTDTYAQVLGVMGIEIKYTRVLNGD